MGCSRIHSTNRSFHPRRHYLLHVPAGDSFYTVHWTGLLLPSRFPRGRWVDCSFRRGYPSGSSCFGLSFPWPERKLSSNNKRAPAQNAIIIHAHSSSSSQTGSADPGMPTNSNSPKSAAARHSIPALLVSGTFYDENRSATLYKAGLFARLSYFLVRRLHISFANWGVTTTARSRTTTTLEAIGRYVCSLGEVNMICLSSVRWDAQMDTFSRCLLGKWT